MNLKEEIQRRCDFCRSKWLNDKLMFTGGKPPCEIGEDCDGIFTVKELLRMLEGERC